MFFHSAKWNGSFMTSIKFKRIFQMMSFAVTLIYMSLVLYQNVYGYRRIQEIEISAALEGVDTTPSANTIEDKTTRYTDNSLQRDTAADNKLHRINNKRILIDQRSVTATTKPPTTELDDIFLSVKTTKGYHATRLQLIIDTWFQLAKQQTWFFTDADDSLYQQKTNGHMINTNCSMGHYHKALCCKMSSEFDAFLESGKKWFCHFDDDNYVNIPRLVMMLSQYSPTIDWYIGKPSIASPLEIYVENEKSAATTTTKKISFVFATGGAGFCTSRALALKMLPIAGNGKFMSIGERISLPDDVTMGYVIEYLLKVRLTVVDTFHSHLEPMQLIRPEAVRDQVTFSYGRMQEEKNVIKIDGLDTTVDPTRFYTLHCHLFPYFSVCKR